MKNIFIIIAIFILLTAVHAESINECKTDIYFGNGVWNSPESAKENKKYLEKLIKKR